METNTNSDGHSLSKKDALDIIVYVTPMDPGNARLICQRIHAKLVGIDNERCIMIVQEQKPLKVSTFERKKFYCLSQNDFSTNKLSTLVH